MLTPLATLATEDAAPISGKLLANDTDVDAGTTLTIANPGAKVGAYGTLTLAADGTYSYSLANARPANDDAWRMSA